MNEAIVSIYHGPNQADTDLSEKLPALENLLTAACAEFTDIRLASSLAAEDNILFDAMARLGLNIAVFSLDTGRLNAETLAVIPALQAKYGKAPSIITPQAAAVENYVNTHGADAFYNSVELRKACCEVRKVEPLNRALAGAQAWITGQRKAQASTRQYLPVREQDNARNMVKLNPLSDWSEADVWTYVRQFSVPVNALHSQGYPSIGCAPCTRGISIGEDIRAGRWWWEDPSSKECGLHASNLNQLNALKTA
jgi:phosphoadenosine phosphosulfate reductase